MTLLQLRHCYTTSPNITPLRSNTPRPTHKGDCKTRVRMLITCLSAWHFWVTSARRAAGRQRHPRPAWEGPQVAVHKSEQCSATNSRSARSTAQTRAAKIHTPVHKNTQYMSENERTRPSRPMREKHIASSILHLVSTQVHLLKHTAMSIQYTTGG